MTTEDDQRILLPLEEHPEHYRRLEDTWQCMLREFRGWTVPWLTTVFIDGTPFGDGDPIASARSASRGVRVRHVLDEMEPRVGFWFDDFDGIPVLVVDYVASPVTTEIARLLVGTWCSGKEQQEVELALR